MVRYGRGFPLPRQTFMVNPVSDEISTTVIYTSGLNTGSAVGATSIYISEEESTAIIGVGADTAVGSADVGIIIGGINESVAITGVSASGDLGTISTNSPDYSPWKHPKGKVPRKKWKKHKHFPDYYYQQGVEFIPMIASENQYGPHWNVSTVTADRILIRKKATISSDYSIEGRP